MVRTEIDPTTGLDEPGENEGHLHLPPAGVIPVFAELSRIKSVIGIKYPKMKFFLEVGSREGNPASHTPKVAVGSGRSMRSRRWENGFLVMPPEVEGLDFMKLKGAGVPIKQSQGAFHAPRLGASKRPLYFRRRRAVSRRPAGAGVLSPAMS